MATLRFIFLIFLFPLVLNAQKRLGHAPFFQSFNAKKLAHALTDGLENDSLKVHSIYLWTTRHIKYDVKKLQKGKASHVKPRKILLHRKAVCLGYSILFDSLCTYAGINSDMVLGYAYPQWYEARDTLFLDNHAWNVVQVNGEWKLIDATWASGYVKPRLQLGRKMLWILFRIPYTPKSRFKRKRNDFYFETPPELFVYTHLPSTPAWQLLPCSVPIDSFQRSPTATMNFLRSTVIICADGNDSIPAIQAEPKCRHQVIMGKQAIDYNNGNHQDISLGYWYYSEVIYNEAQNKKLDGPSRIILYDSTMHQLDSATNYFLATAANAKEEQAFFLARNKRMRKQVLDENKPLIERQDKYRDELRRERIYAQMKVGKLRKENRHLKKAARTFRKHRLRIKRPENAKPGEERLTRMLLQQIDSVNKLISILADSTRIFVFYADEYSKYDSSLAVKKAVIDYQVKVQAGIRLMRKQGLINSYDTLMIKTKAHVFSCERKMDSLDKLIRHGKEWQTNKNNRAYAEKVKAMDELFAYNIKLCKQLGRMTETSFSEDSVFDAQKKQYTAWSDSLIAENNKLIETYRAYHSATRSLKRFHRRAWKRYHKEIGAEFSRVAFTNALFRGYFGSVSDMMKHNAGKCHKKKAHCRVIRNKLIQEEEKRVKEEAKKRQSSVVGSQ